MSVLVLGLCPSKLSNSRMINEGGSSMGHRLGPQAGAKDWGHRLEPKTGATDWGHRLGPQTGPKDCGHRQEPKSVLPLLPELFIFLANLCARNSP